MKKTESYFLNENYTLFKKILIQNKNFDIKNKRISCENKNNYFYLYIPETSDILTYLKILAQKMAIGE